MAIASTKKHCMEMEISEISKLEINWSQEISIHGIPWKISVRKMEQDAEQSIGVYLHCANKDKSPNWSLSGIASFKLLPFRGDVNSIEYHTDPYVFDAYEFGYGTHGLIKWNNLFNQEKEYVKDDTINLEVKVSAENPNDPKRCRLNFECIQKCCDNSYLATFRLTVTNILNLMAVRSPQFTLRDLPWNFQISKQRSSHLGALLQLKEKSEKVNCKTSMTIKLLSLKNNVQPIEKCITKQYTCGKNLDAVDVISWDEMVKPKNGYINNGSITLEVEVKVNDPEGDMPIAKRTKLNPQNGIKTPQMECPICFKCIANQKLAATPCGHLFCFECIKKAISGRAACPSCNKAVQLNTLREIFLPGVN